jgi:alcohol dehydrogenase class IV
MKPFIYNALPARVIFDAPAATAIAAELSRLGCKRGLLLSTKEQAAATATLAQSLGDGIAGHFAEAVMHTPVEITERALEIVHKTGADCLIAIGGGSTIGLGKALALRTDLPQIAVPTTYAGSEATPILGETASGRKTTQRTLKVLPGVIIYDVDLTLTLPPGLTVTSGVNAIAHAVEALYAREANPVIRALACDGIARFAAALPRIAQAPDDRAARSDALYGAWACGTCLGAVGMALHHKLCHVLGGSFNLPHAETHTVVLPHALAYNAPAAAEAARDVARALGGDGDAAGALFDLVRTVGGPVSLRDLGMPGNALDRAASLAVADPYWNPRPIDEKSIRALLDDAWHGRRPAAPV